MVGVGFNNLLLNPLASPLLSNATYMGKSEG
jgi:hypothetical protein